MQWLSMLTSAETRLDQHNEDTQTDFPLSFSLPYFC